MEIGEIQYGKKLGKSDTAWYQWQPCATCGKPRWVRLIGRGRLRSRICKDCSSRLPSPKGEKSPLWKGGRINDGRYILIWVEPNDFFYPMAGKKGRYVLEHRLVMAQSLGRNLQRWEVVHHKNGIKNDNRRENLELSNGGAHLLLHSQGYKDGYIKGLTDGRNEQIKLLKNEIAQCNRIYQGY